MRTNIKMLLSCMALLLSAVFVAGCEEMLNENKEFNVYYYSNDGETVKHLGVVTGLRKCRKVAVGHLEANPILKKQGYYNCCVIEGGNSCAKRMK